MATRRSRTPWEFQLEQSCRAWRGPVAGFGHCWKATNYRWSTDMMSIAPITEQELHAYLDGELPDARARLSKRTCASIRRTRAGSKPIAPMARRLPGFSPARAPQRPGRGLPAQVHGGPSRGGWQLLRY